MLYYYILSPSTAEEGSINRFGWLLSVLLALGTAGSQADSVDSTEPEIQLLVSSQPLALLLGEILPEDAAVRLDVLVSPGSSLHHPSLRPSQRMALADAQRVIWLGPRLEPALARYLDTVPAERLINLDDLTDLVLLEYAGTGQLDSHVWLSPDNAIRLAATMRESLPDQLFNTRGMSRNLAEFEAHLKLDMEQMRRRFAKLEDPRFIAVHDAFAYLNNYFQLRQLGALIDTNEQPIGAKTLWDLQRRIPPATDICLLDNVQFPSDQGAVLAERTTFHKVSVDLSGAGYQPQRGEYRRYLGAILELVHTCLQSNQAVAELAVAE